MLDEIAFVMVMCNVSDVTQDRGVYDKACHQRDAEALETLADELTEASFRERVGCGYAGKKEHQSHKPGADEHDHKCKRLYVIEKYIVLLAPCVVGHAGVIEDQQ